MPVETISLIINFVLIFVVMWFFLIRPERKRRNEITSMQNSLQKGDRVVTIGGVHGRIHSIDELTISLINDSGVVWTFERSAVSRKVD